MKTVINKKPLLPVLAACGLYAILTLFIVRPWQGAAGLDIYYYALQIKALHVNGHLLFADFSPVYFFGYLFNLIIRNPVLAAQLVSVISALLCFSSVLLIVRKKADSSMYSVAVLMIVNPLFFMLQWEFTKNLFALALALAGYCLLVLNDTARRWKSKGFLTGITLIVLASLSHRLIALVVLLLALQVAIGLINKKVTRKLFLFLFYGAGAVSLIILMIMSWNLWHDRLSYLSLKAPLARLKILTGKNLYLSQKLFFSAVQISIPLSLILFFLKQPFRQKGAYFLKPEFTFFMLSQVFVFPFLLFNFDEIGFRLLIMAPVVWGLWLITSFRKIRLPVQLLLTALLGIIVFQGISLNQTARSPDYKALDRELTGIEDYLQGKRLIAQRGTAGFLWFEKGIWTENFIPADYKTNPENWYRLVYLFREEVFRPYLREGEELPGFSTPRYLLIQETVWQRFYQKKKELQFLKSNLNPFLPRPETGFRIHRETAIKMSPVSFHHSHHSARSNQKD